MVRDSKTTSAQQQKLVAEQADEPERFGFGESHCLLRMQPNFSPGYP
jgi:hypothetical protein